jgi:hypothetical protein
LAGLYFLIIIPFGLLIKIYQTVSPGIENIMKRIDIFGLDPDRVMKMGSHRTAGVSHIPYYFPPLHFLPPFDIVSGEMAVSGGHSSAVVDPNVFAQISVLTLSVNDTICRCNNGRALATAYV